MNTNIVGQTFFVWHPDFIQFDKGAPWWNGCVGSVSVVYLHEDKIYVVFDFVNDKGDRKLQDGIHVSWLSHNNYKEDR